MSTKKASEKRKKMLLQAAFLQLVVLAILPRREGNEREDLQDISGIQEFYRVVVMGFVATQ